MIAIATWRMSLDGVSKAGKMMKEGIDATSALKALINDVENNPFYKSVGYGALPNREGVMQYDGAFMDSRTLDLGAVAAVENIKNVIDLAESLSHENRNSFLASNGALKYAKEVGFKPEDLLTDFAKKYYLEKKDELDLNETAAYDGHDTIGAICIDKDKHMVLGTSTSGLFMKRDGRVGDSPLPGAGYFTIEGVGAAVCTGVGEDIMKGALASRAIFLLEEGYTAKEAAEISLLEHNNRLIRVRGEAGGMSMIVVDSEENIGIATNVPFTYTVSNGEEATCFTADLVDGQIKIERTSDEWLEAYLARYQTSVE